MIKTLKRPAAPSGRPAGPAAALSLRRKILAWSVLFLITVPNVFVSLSTARSRGGDFRGYLIAGERFLAGRFLYEGSGVATNVTWPPFFSVFITPFALLARASLPLTQMLWYCLNITLFFFAVHLWCRIAYGRPLGGFDGTDPLSLIRAPVLVPILLVTDPLMRNFVQLQINPMILFFITMGFFSLTRKKDGAAGFWFGLAAAIKAFPAILFLFLLIRKRFRAAAWMAASGLALTALPGLRYGVSGLADHVRAWIGLSLSGGYPVGSLNQSAYAMIARWVASDPFLLMKTRLPPPAPDAPAAIAATWIFRGLLLSFLAVFWYIAVKRRRRHFAAEAAFWTVLGMVFSPVAWMHYWVLIFPAVFVLWREVSIPGRGRIAAIWFWSSAFLITGLNVIDRAIRQVGSVSHCLLSNMTLGALVLLAAMLWILAGPETGAADGTGRADSGNGPLKERVA
jgi:hypothetical protein